MKCECNGLETPNPRAQFDKQLQLYKQTGFYEGARKVSYDSHRSMEASCTEHCSHSQSTHCISLCSKISEVFEHINESMKVWTAKEVEALYSASPCTTECLNINGFIVNELRSVQETSYCIFHMFQALLFSYDTSSSQLSYTSCAVSHRHQQSLCF